MRRICRVFGNPIAQSKSPLIHSLFAKQFDLDLGYDKCADGITDIENAFTDFFKNEAAVGANITLPFKQRAFDFADTLSSHALRSGAVNTLFKKDGQLFGDNTDGRGLVWDFKRNGVTLKGAKVLLVGAGGAAKGCIPALFDAGISLLHISNRTTAKAKVIVDQLAANSDWNLSLFKDTETYDVIINATSLSLHGQIPSISTDILSAANVCYDMVYLDEPTAFLQHARKVGITTTIDGIGMLVGQAAESFKLWFDLSPDLTSVINTIKS